MPEPATPTTGRPPGNGVWDVAVVGAGPAGATAARLLAGAGARTVLLERAPLPRYKPCGGGLVGKTLALLPPEAQAAVERRCPAATLVLGEPPMRFPTRREGPIVCTTMRSALDGCLTDLAAKAGTEVRDRCPVGGLERRTDHVALATPGGEVRARFVVAADGSGGSTARLAGWTGAPTLIPAVEHEVTVAPETLAAWGDTCRFDFGLVPQGYGWVFPKRDHLSVGVLTTRIGRIDLNAAVEPYLERLGIRPLAVERHGHRIPFRPRPGPLARDRVLLAGDTAGLADPLTLEGISFALTSGQLAAEALTGTGLDPARAAPLYQTRVADTLLAEIAAAAWFAKMMYVYPRAALKGFKWLGREGCDGVAAVMAGEITYRELLARVPGVVLRRLVRPFVRRGG